MDEGAGLAAGPVDGQRVADRRLHQKAIQDRPVVAVVVEAVDQPVVQPRLGGLGAPHDPLVQIGDPGTVVLVVVREQQLILGLGHVVDRARVGRVQDFLANLAAVVGVDLDLEVALRDLDPGGAVAVDAHRPQVHDVRVELGLDQRGQQVVGRVDVVEDRVALVPRALHRVRRGALLGEVDDRIGLVVGQQVQQHPVVLGDVEPMERDLTAGQLAPGRQARPDRRDRRQRLGLELDVGVAPRQVVDDLDVVARGRQMQRRRPSTEAVSTEDQDAQGASPWVRCVRRRWQGTARRQHAGMGRPATEHTRVAQGPVATGRIATNAGALRSGSPTARTTGSARSRSATRSRAGRAAPVPARYVRCWSPAGTNG